MTTSPEKISSLTEGRETDALVEREIMGRSEASAFEARSAPSKYFSACTCDECKPYGPHPFSTDSNTVRVMEEQLKSLGVEEVYANLLGRNVDGELGTLAHTFAIATAPPLLRCKVGLLAMCDELE